MNGYWPWWAGALALTAVAAIYFRVVGRLLGVSGNFSRATDGPGDEAQPALEDLAALDAMLAATREEFGDAAVQDGAAAGGSASARNDLPVAPRPRAAQVGWGGNL